MAAPSDIVKDIMARMLADGGLEKLKSALTAKRLDDFPLPERLPAITDYSEEAVQKRLNLLRERGGEFDHVLAKAGDPTAEDLAGNIENFIGYSKIPLGIIGPLRINGTAANGDFYVPMATSEGALTASYSRGANLISYAGGCTAICMTEAVQRAPCFIFEDIKQVAEFLVWMYKEKMDNFQEIISKNSRYCKLIDVKPTITGKELYLSFEYSTGDAAGQNMVTMATDAICKDMMETTPIKPRYWFIDGNLSGDKKATMNSFLYTRGKKVVAEVILPRQLVRRFLRATPEDIMEYWQISFIGGTHSGAIGAQGHFANALAAMFIACGQDAACVSEASVGITRMDIANDGDLYVSVSLPNLIVGTVGGGTKLPTAHECLKLLGCVGEGTARKFAEICAATVLSGEISIIGAMTAGDFSEAHQRFRPSSQKG